MSGSQDPRVLLCGRLVIGADGEKVGTITRVYLDPVTARADWAAVRSGIVRRQVSLVPLARAQEVIGDIRVPYGKAQVRSAPPLFVETALTSHDQATLREHYEPA